MSRGDDDFIMTINDDDEVPDLEQVDEESDIEPQNKKRKSADSQKTKRSKGKSSDEGPISKNFMIDLDADGLDAVPQTLDFTLARASLKKRNKSSQYTTLDEKIAIARRRARQEKKKQSTKDEEEADEEEDENVAEKDSDQMSVSENEEEDDKEDAASAAGSDSESEAASEPESESEGESQDGSDSENDDESEEESESESSDSGSESEVDEAEEARKREYFAQEEETQSDLPDSFTVMNLSRPIMKGLSKLNFTQPTPIQARTIPVALLGKDICGGAQTGSGKTGAFLVPILERLLYRPKKVPATRVLILCPTRELAIQCHNVGTQLAGFTDITMCLCIG
ncbi:nucleolar DEAD-box protein required for synthesis of 60S ribosomal subunit, partial [Coemansia sp. RSA 2703]